MGVWIFPDQDSHPPLLRPLWYTVLGSADIEGKPGTPDRPAFTQAQSPKAEDGTSPGQLPQRSFSISGSWRTLKQERLPDGTMDQPLTRLPELQQFVLEDTHEPFSCTEKRLSGTQPSSVRWALLRVVLPLIPRVLRGTPVHGSQQMFLFTVGF